MKSSNVHPLLEAVRRLLPLTPPEAVSPFLPQALEPLSYDAAMTQA